MKFQPDKSDTKTITAYGPGWIAVDQETFKHSILLSSLGELRDWNCSRFEDLGAEHFAQLTNFGVDTVIFGSGQRLRFPPAAWLAPLMGQRLGLETMDTQAACRTYNILAGEGRKVLLAALLETAT